MKPFHLLFTILFFSTIINSNAQDDLLDSLEHTIVKEKQYTSASFKGTHLINLHTIETLGKKSLDFRITHRFGDFSSGGNNLWGLDGPATIKLGFDYGITDRLMIGIGRSSYGKLYDGFIKYKLLRQTTDNTIPISAVGIASINITTVKNTTSDITGFEKYSRFSSRISYFYQILIARKFNKNLSLQITPTFIHYNLVDFKSDKNDMFALAGSGRYKVSRSISITGEYIWRVTNYSSNYSLYHNSASIGVDIETGGHVFQLFVTNSIPINEVQLIPYTVSSWTKGEVRLGFNISRIFGWNKHQKKKKDEQKIN